MLSLAAAPMTADEEVSRNDPATLDLDRIFSAGEFKERRLGFLRL